MGFLMSDYRASEAGYAPMAQEQQGMLGQAQKGQLSLAQMLQAQAAGTGPNAARGLMQRGAESAIKQNAGLIASQRGINPALAQRLAAQNAAEQGQQAAANAAILQAQQSQQALGQMGNVYGQLGQLANQNIANQYSALGNAQQTNAAIEKSNTGILGGLIGGALSGVGGLLGSGATSSGGSSLMAGDATIPSSSSFTVPRLGSSYGYSHGGKVPGKPVFGGDHPENDTVPAMLSPGEIVIPRSKANDPEKAKAFIDHLSKKSDPNKNPSEEVSYADVLAYQKKLHEMLLQLGKK